MRNSLLAVFALTSLVACTRGDLDAASSDTSRNVDLVPTGSVGALSDGPVNGGAAARTLPIGSRINATWGKSITSSSNKEGQTVTVTVTSDVKDGRGRTVTCRNEPAPIPPPSTCNPASA